jgi:hypothetical protein
MSSFNFEIGIHGFKGQTDFFSKRYPKVAPGGLVCGLGHLGGVEHQVDIVVLS